MMALDTFLAGMSFVIAIAACLFANKEQHRAQIAERALNAALVDQDALLMKLANADVELEAMIRAVAAASVPPVLPRHSSQVYISVPGPRTLQ